MDVERSPGSCAATCFCLVARKDAFTNAVEQGREEEVHDMLRRDVRLMKRRWLSRMSAWHIAAAMGHTNILKTLVDVVLTGGSNVTAMMNSSLRRMLAMTTTSEELLKGFLLQGSGGGMTPLMLAARSGHGEAVAYLLSLGEVPGPKSVESIHFSPFPMSLLGSDCWQGDNLGLTALHHAAMKGRVAVIKELLNNPPEPSPLASRLISRTTKYGV
jgi:ankyrin repeat protein